MSPTSSIHPHPVFPIMADGKPTAEGSSKLSDVEKTSGSHELPRKNKLDLFEDPDEGLSEEEKAKIVGPIC